MIKDVKIPEISENVTSGKIVAVLVEPGDSVAVDDTLVEMETDKAVVEIPSPYAGKISEVLVDEGDEKNVGDVIARIETEGEAGEEEVEDKEAEPRETETDQSRQDRKEEEEPQKQETPRTEKQATEPERAEEKQAEKGHPEPASEKDAKSSEKSEGKKDGESRTDREETDQPAPAGPSVRRTARELGVAIGDVPGSGPKGRITQADVHDYVRKRLSGEAAAAGPAQSAAGEDARLPDFSRWGPVRTEKLDTVRRLTAESTGLSWRLAPQVTQFDEADITDLQDFLAAHAEKVEKKGGKLTITAVILKICAVALSRFARFNASIDMQNGALIYKDYIHIGMAVDTPRGLLVPVIRDVPSKNIFELAAEIVDLAQRARNKKIKPEEFEGGTFTISNQGGIGGRGFTPVILWPQAAILGVSRARRMLTEKQGDFLPRTILPLCVTYDHRIVDGADAARFLDWICRSLENPMNVFT